MVFQPFILGTAFLAMSGHALASGSLQPPKTYGSASKCKLTSISSASAESAKVATFVASKVSATLCLPDSSDFESSATATAKETADAFASALVDATAECYASGGGSFTVNGKSLASAEAVAIAEAYAEAQASAKICGKCKASGVAVAKSFKKIFLKATAEVELELQGMADDGDVSAMASAVSESMQKVTVVAFATAIADARVKYGECDGSAQADTGAGQPGDISSATSCKIDLNAASSEVVSDALVDIAGEAAAKVCSGGSAPASASAEFDVEGRAVAEAMALAMTKITSSCYTKGKGYGCTAGEAEIKKTATAVATIFAEGFSEATSECYKGCLAEAESLSRVIAEILATATSKTMADQCTGPKPHFTLEKSEVVIATATATAIAKAIGTASADSFGGCEAIAVTEAGIGPITRTTTKIPGGKIVPAHPAHPIYPTYPTPSYKPTHAPIHPAPVHKPSRKVQPVQRRHKLSKKGGRKFAKSGGRGRKVVRKISRKGFKGFKGFKGRRGGKVVKVFKHRFARRGGKKFARRGRKLSSEDIEV